MRHSPHTPRALVVVEWEGRVLMAAIVPSTIEMREDAVDVESLPGPAYLMVEGQMLEATRWWESWADFYDDMGARPPSRDDQSLPEPHEALPETRRALMPLDR